MRIYLMIFLSIFLIKVKSQQIVEIYSSSFLEKDVKLSTKIVVDHIEKDSIVLFDNGTYENFYSYSFFDEFGNSKTVGNYYKKDSIIYLRPLKEYYFEDRIRNVSNYSEIPCEITNEKLDCFKPYRGIKFLQKKK